METLLTLFVVFVVLLLFYWAGHRIAGAAGVGEGSLILVIFDVVLVVVFAWFALTGLGLLSHVRGLHG